jgi:peptidylprolyl isomerase
MTKPRTIRRTAATALVTVVLAGALTGCASSHKPGGSADVTFDGVTVSGATSVGVKPGVSAHSAATPAGLDVKDLVVGSGTPATPTSTVTVQYVGVLLADGKQFDASWDRGQPATFSLQQVVPGFTEGIGGAAGVAGMKAGGRRLMVLPAALGYGASGTPDGGIPPNAPIVFVVDLLSVS